MSLDPTIAPSGEAPLEVPPVPCSGAPLTTLYGTKLVYVGPGTWRDTLRIRVVEGGYETDALIGDIQPSAELTRILNPDTP